MEMARHNTIVAWLLAAIGFVTAGFYLAGSTPAWVPTWLGAAIALALLFGVFFAYWSISALRARYIALFAAALIAAPLLGWFISHA